MTPKYLDSIVKHYEDCLEEHGDTHLGVDWPKLDDVDKRYKVMLEVMAPPPNNNDTFTLLDFGCGAAHLLDYIQKHHLKHINYSGLDVSEKFVALSKSKFPGIDFYALDILQKEQDYPSFDYIVMNGVFTEKRELTFDEMWNYFCELLTNVFAHAKTGLAFNVMSKAVDWEREDLFHLSLDRLADFLTKKLSRNFIIRNDYGLYEYTTYLYK